MNTINAPDAPSASAIMHKNDASVFNLIHNAFGSVTDNYTRENPSSMGELYEPDYSITAYTTKGNNVYLLHANNTITMASTRFLVNSKVLDHYIDFSQFDNNKDGVYILEKIKLNDSIDVEIIDYYLRSKVIEYDPKIVEEIKRQVEDSITRRNTFRQLEIRICTYVPFNKLRDEHILYVKGPNVLLIADTIPEDIVHPYSDSNLLDSLSQIQDENGTVNISLSIVDTENKYYYLKVGNEPIKVPTVNNKDLEELLPNGCNLQIKRNKTILNDIFIEKKDFKMYGLYRDREACLTNNERAQELEDIKYKTELRKSELELAKIKASYEKLKTEYEHKEAMYELELEHKSSMFRIDRTKKIFESSIDRIKKTHDFKFDMDKKLIETTFNMYANSYSSRINIENKRMEHDMNMKHKETEFARNMAFRLIDGVSKLF